jgi:multipile epidermal growth factor-like domains protein 8
MFAIHLSSSSSGQWVEIHPRGGKQLDLRMVAHSAVYHNSTNSLLVYGGIVTGVARFSKLTDRIFAFHIESRYWSELLYPRAQLRDTYVPRERAFHTSTVIGESRVGRVVEATC